MKCNKAMKFWTSLFLIWSFCLSGCAPAIQRNQSETSNAGFSAVSSESKKTFLYNVELAKKLSVDLDLNLPEEMFSRLIEQDKQGLVDRVQKVLEDTQKRPQSFGDLALFCKNIGFTCEPQALDFLEKAFEAGFSNFHARGDSVLALTGSNPVDSASQSSLGSQPNSPQGQGFSSYGLSSKVERFHRQQQVAFAPLVYVGLMAIVTVTGLVALSNVQGSEARKAFARANGHTFLVLLLGNQNIDCKSFKDDPNSCRQLIRNVSSIQARFSSQAKCPLQIISKSPQNRPAISELVAECSLQQADARAISDLLITGL